MKTDIFKLGLLILLACRSTLVFAVWYQVEMIVFENLYPDTDGEKWYKSSELVPLENTVNLLPIRMSEVSIQNIDEGQQATESELVAFQILPENNNRLDGVNRVLRLSREYRPLYHISWQQPGLEQNQARPVHVQAEDSTNLFELTIPPLLVTESMPADFYEPIKLVFDGVLRVRSSLYLHVDLDMVLYRAPPAGEIEQTEIMEGESEQVMHILNEPVEYVRMTESRRIILNELHYFDHPLFGVILQVSRYGP